ncbi:hypothetical protein H0E87_024492 [Populus deltoides]|uniref:Uncharacterized protein n=1 Tax=Populus deltoides TaxID=3696 RepID=A0A8T2X917_POPDE|nr:hypothetical protein H0E87_024492 [Populus deltoides]
MVTTMDTLVLLPGFINFFGKAKNHSSSPGDLAVIFLAFGKLSLHVNDFHFHVLAWHSHCSPYASQIVYLDAVLNLAFALSLLCFLVMHASLVSSNTTSIEVYEKKGVARWKYDLGRKKNFEQVIPVVLLYIYLSCICIVPGERMSLVWQIIDNFNYQFICANLQFCTR